MYKVARLVENAKRITNNSRIVELARKALEEKLMGRTLSIEHVAAIKTLRELNRAKYFFAGPKDEISDKKLFWRICERLRKNHESNKANKTNEIKETKEEKECPLTHIKYPIANLVAKWMKDKEYREFFMGEIFRNRNIRGLAKLVFEKTKDEMGLSLLGEIEEEETGDRYE